MRKTKVDKLIGTKFGRLLVESVHHRNLNCQYYVNCLCDCGTKVIVRDAHLRAGTVKSCGCFQADEVRLNITGQKFGKLFVVDLHSLKNHQTYWLCKCDCGNACIIKGTYLINSHTKSCGCLLYPNRLALGESSLRGLIRSYRSHAKKRNFEFELTKENCHALFSGICFYCGKEPNQINKHPEYFGNFIYNGIDRIDSAKGYFKDNCVSCCKLCNWMKRELGIKEFLEHIKRIYEYKINEVSC